jgi:capsular polysaccharide biosynthesis protein
MDYRDLWDAVRPNLLRIIAVSLAVGAIVGLVASQLPKTYEATTKLVVGGTVLGDPPSIDGIEAASRLTQTLAELAMTRPVLSAALVGVGDATDPEDFRDGVDARAAQDSLVLLITVRAPDAAQAATLANSVANELIVQSPLILGATGPGSALITPLERALPPSDAIAPRVLLYAVLAAVAAGIGLVVLVMVLAARGARDEVPAGVVPTWPPVDARRERPQTARPRN